MSKYKVVIHYETEVNANDEEEARESVRKELIESADNIMEWFSEIRKSDPSINEKEEYEIVDEIKELLNEKFKILNDLNHQNRKEQINEYIKEISFKISEKEKRLFDLTGKKSYFDYVFKKNYN